MRRTETRPWSMASPITLRNGSENRAGGTSSAAAFNRRVPSRHPARTRRRRPRAERRRYLHVVPPLRGTGVRPGSRRLGRRRLPGRGCGAGHGEAVRWCRLSAEQGDRDGQCCLGLLYASGAGVERDAAESVKWLRPENSRRAGRPPCRGHDRRAVGRDEARRRHLPGDLSRLLTRRDATRRSAPAASGYSDCHHLRRVATAGHLISSH